MLKTASITLAFSLTFSSAIAQDRKPHPTPSPKPDSLAQAVDRNTQAVAGLTRQVEGLTREIGDLKNKKSPTAIELPDPGSPVDSGFYAYQCALGKPPGQYPCDVNSLAARFCSGKPAPGERNALPVAVGFTGGIASQAKRYTDKGTEYLQITKVLCY